MSGRILTPIGKIQEIKIKIITLPVLTPLFVLFPNSQSKMLVELNELFFKTLCGIGVRK